MKLEDIEKAVAELPSDELAEFRKWFHAFDAQQWDRQFEQDVRKGKLDHFAEEAIADYQAGRAKNVRWNSESLRKIHRLSERATKS